MYNDDIERALVLILHTSKDIIEACASRVLFPNPRSTDIYRSQYWTICVYPPQSIGSGNCFRRLWLYLEKISVCTCVVTRMHGAESTTHLLPYIRTYTPPWLALYNKASLKNGAFQPAQPCIQSLFHMLVARLSRLYRLANIAVYFLGLDLIWHWQNIRYVIPHIYVAILT